METVSSPKNYYVFMLTLESPREPMNYTLYQQRFDINSESIVVKTLGDHEYEITLEFIELYRYTGVSAKNRKSSVLFSSW